MHYHSVFKVLLHLYHQSPIPDHAVFGKMSNHLKVLDGFGTFFNCLWSVKQHDTNPANTGMLRLRGISEISVNLWIKTTLATD
jgi:hypothetical protein